jgi:signal transduction histidine kinase
MSSEKLDWSRLTQLVINLAIWWTLADVLWRASGHAWPWSHLMYVGTAIAVGSFVKSVRLTLVIVVFLILALVLWQFTGYFVYLFGLLYAGAATGVGVALYVALPKRLGDRERCASVGLVLILLLSLTAYFYVQNASTVLITLERTPCFGSCPSYKLTIRGDGSVVYQGQSNVAVEGRHEAAISQEKVQELLAEFERVDYYSFKNEYHDPFASITDFPTTITSLTLDGRRKTVRHYHGDMSAPGELTALEFKIDEITNSEQWVGD